MTTPLTPEQVDYWRKQVVDREDGIRPWLDHEVVALAARFLATLDRERRERVDPDLRAVLVRLTEIDQRTPIGNCMSLINEALAATEAPREPDMDYERRDAMLDVVRRAYPATPDHTVVGEEREAQIERIAAAIHDTDPTHQDTSREGGLAMCPDRAGYLAWAATLNDRAGLRATPRPR